jgi:hypothetical protein
MGNKCAKTKKHVINKESEPESLTQQNDNNKIGVDSRQQENGPQPQLQPQPQQQPIVRTPTNGNISKNLMPLQPMPSINVEIVESVVIAMYSYNARHDGDLTFRKGEKLEIVEKNDPDWWTVKRLETGEVGYIPSNYVGTTALESEE